LRKKVLVPIADGSEELEAIGIVDTLRRAGAEVTVASVDELQITASRGTKLTADLLIDACREKKYELIALPGGLPGAEHLRDNAILTELLREQAATNRYYAAICASPVVVLQHHGLLQGKSATAHPSILANLAPESLKHESVVVDGNCITSQGPGTVLEFSLKLIELLFDRSRADKIAKAMLVEKY
jgi:4-methyl-5(b-hydroxyethyl)-thiazole monophosphate biosynthesis